MRSFWVVGGEYTDTSFAHLLGDSALERYGAFDSYAEARAVWRAKAMRTADASLYRYSIEEEDATAYWVVGASYTDTTFKETVGGVPEERQGPFPSYHEAFETWRARAMATVDDAHARFRIERV
jgi:hypothetical protein